MNKNKKAQLAVFIIIALAIIVAIALILVAVKSSKENNNVPIEVQPVNSFIEACVKQVAQESIYNIGQTGGYFDLPEKSTKNNIAYHYYLKENIMPSRAMIESELEKYVDTMLFFCTKDFSEFNELEIRQGIIKTKTKIDDNQVIFNVIYPVSVTKGDKTYQLKEFNDIIVPVRLGIVYDMSYNMMIEQLKTEDICLSCINDLAVDRDLFLDMRDYGVNKEDVIFTIIDRNSKINNEDYRFYFANKYKL
ncbi:MAG: hypothetical protein WC867_02585 [Candidatus Pacearchaeota archaeon]|jgi:hypothetical protein